MARPEQPDELRIDWSTAEVHTATLSVRLAGPSRRGLAKRFDGVRRLLEHSNGRWGAIALAKGFITVDEVEEGAEEDLRHFLESIVLQVNSDLHPDPPEPPPGEDGRQTADGEMASRFQAFAGAEPDLERSDAS